MSWRLFMLPVSNRWLEYPGAEELATNPEGWGIPLPEGARIHSIQPLERRVGVDDDFRAGRREAVAEWAVFVAVSVDDPELAEAGAQSMNGGR